VNRWAVFFFFFFFRRRSTLAFAGTRQAMQPDVLEFVSLKSEIHVNII
jgi:hypothetical protein